MFLQIIARHFRANDPHHRLAQTCAQIAAIFCANIFLNKRAIKYQRKMAANQLTQLELSIAATAHMFYAMKRNRRFVFSYEDLIHCMNAAARRCYDCKPFDKYNLGLRKLRRDEVEILLDMGARINANIMTIPAHLGDQSPERAIEVLQPFARELRDITEAQIRANDLQH